MKATIAASKGATKTGKSDAMTLLKADHRKVEQLFAQYEQSEDEEEKRKLARQVCLELIVHTKLEEEIFYPACREKDVEDELLDEAQVEHDGAKVLIADLLRNSPGDEYYDAKLKTLSEYIKHHVGEEEKPRSGILAKAQKAGVDMAALGEKLQARKTELMAESETLCSRPPQPRSFTFNPQRMQSQETSNMARYDEDYRGSRSNYRERDDQGRFMSDDEDGGGRRSARGHSGGSGWHGDSEGHSRASREGWDERYSGRQSRSRHDDEDDGRRSSSSRGGRGQGGWFGDSEGHSQASREGWRHSSHEGSGWYGDPEGHSEASREGWRHSGHEGSGWYGDPEGHSEASREGWDERGGRGRSRSSRSRDEDDDDRRSSRGGSRGGRGHGGWFGDSEGHSQASREGWRDR